MRRSRQRTGGTFGGIVFTLYDVSTPLPALVAGGSGLTAIYDDPPQVPALPAAALALLAAVLGGTGWIALRSRAPRRPRG